MKRRSKSLQKINSYFRQHVLLASTNMEKAKNSNVLPVVLAGLWFKLDCII